MQVPCGCGRPCTAWRFKRHNQRAASFHLRSFVRPVLHISTANTTMLLMFGSWMNSHMFSPTGERSTQHAVVIDLQSKLHSSWTCSIATS